MKDINVWFFDVTLVIIHSCPAFEWYKSSDSYLEFLRIFHTRGLNDLLLLFPVCSDTNHVELEILYTDLEDTTLKIYLSNQILQLNVIMYHLIIKGRN